MSNNEKPSTNPPIENVADLIAAMRSCRLVFGTDTVWYRGQADASWPLVPSVHRGHDFRWEKNVIRLFHQHAPSRYARCPEKDDAAAWLFLAQHYRLPTRLLDWSGSILTAAYFAVSELDETPGVVWAMKPSVLNRFQTKSEGLFPPDHPAAAPMFLRPFDPVRAGKEGREAERVVAVIPQVTDTRMLIQQACCTIHGTAQPIESIPEADGFTMRLEIPAQAKPNVREELTGLGITQSFLFPDLEHLAMELKTWSFVVPPPIDS